MGHTYEIIALFVFCCLLSTVLAQYEDVRCKCVCEGRTSKTNGTKENFFIIKSVDFDQCSCDQLTNRDHCPQCQCRYESRKTGVIKGVVILILITMCCLFLYMIFLQALEPFFNKRQGAYRSMNRSGPDDIQPLTENAPVVISVTRQRSISDPVSQVVSRAKTQREKWKDNVEVQRTNVYNDHRLLN